MTTRMIHCLPPSPLPLSKSLDPPLHSNSGGYRLRNLGARPSLRTWGQEDLVIEVSLWGPGTKSRYGDVVPRNWSKIKYCKNLSSILAFQDNEINVATKVGSGRNWGLWPPVSRLKASLFRNSFHLQSSSVFQMDEALARAISTNLFSWKAFAVKCKEKPTIQQYRYSSSLISSSSLIICTAPGHYTKNASVPRLSTVKQQ